MKIMVVDDELIQMEKLKKIITEVIPSCHAVGFTDSLEALTWAQKNKPEIAFLDIQMPGMDGIALAKKLKIGNPRINLVFVTGYQEEYVLGGIQDDGHQSHRDGGRSARLL